MKGTTEYFSSTYNSIQSPDVGIVNTILEIDISDKHQSISNIGTPNSVTIIKKNGQTITERYYGENGDAYLDIDYTDHGNPGRHPKVPHQHKWIKNEYGILIRQKE